MTGWFGFLPISAVWGPRPGSRGEARARPLGPCVAGSWYPADPDALARDVDAFLAAGEPSRGETRVAALVAPHAGFMYSGAVAGKGFARVKGDQPSRVILMGPSHQARFRGAALPEADHMRTPLGKVPIDRGAIAALRGCPGFSESDDPFRREHCLEAELPFLQRALLPGWRALPLLVGCDTSTRDAKSVADSLVPFFDSGTLVVVSSDFSHYGRAFGYLPFHTDIPDRLRSIDLAAAERIASCDADGFDHFVESHDATICGHDAISILLRLIPSDSRGELVEYDTSGRMTGDWSHSVSYASIVFVRGTRPPGEAASRRLSDSERRTLLALARAAVEDAVRRDGSLERARERAALTPELNRERAAFVTLKEPDPDAGTASSRWRLRGCIGSLVPKRPLVEDVIHNAIEAALRDPRFAPVAPEEVHRLAISVSALSPITPVASPSEIRPGRHGVLLEKGGFRAVFLPQVASEQGWGTAELLEHLARKAGLPRDAWRDASLSVFEAEVFGAGEAPLD